MTGSLPQLQRTIALAKSDIKCAAVEAAKKKAVEAEEYRRTHRKRQRRPLVAAPVDSFSTCDIDQVKVIQSRGDEENAVSNSFKVATETSITSNTLHGGTQGTVCGEFGQEEIYQQPQTSHDADDRVRISVEGC